MRAPTRRGTWRKPDSRRIIDLCAGTGAWSQPYVDAGYEVVRIDVKDGIDVRLLKAPLSPVHGILAAPPCTVFSRARRDTRLLDETLHALSVVDACLRYIMCADPTWWALENPRGRLGEYIGRPRYKFHPAEYGDGYTKLTWLWGNFTIPPTTHPITEEDKAAAFVANAKGGKLRAGYRAITPPGFARAFFEANP